MREECSEGTLSEGALALAAEFAAVHCKLKASLGEGRKSLVEQEDEEEEELKCSLSRLEESAPCLPARIRELRSRREDADDDPFSPAEPSGPIARVTALLMEEEAPPAAEQFTPSHELRRALATLRRQQCYALAAVACRSLKRGVGKELPGPEGTP
eukprot:Sspe_Gene.93752::Locus_66281_Transcript_2_2_Confidence_0.750_Length_1673::g.93752::m.93752